MTDRVVTVDDTFKLPPDVLTPLDARYPAAAGSGSTVVTVGKSAKFNYNTASYASDDLAVQAAVDAIPAGYNGGTEIRIGPGIFNFVGGVNTTAKHNVTISGSLATIIQWKNGNTFAAATPATNWLFKLGDYAVLRDLQLRGCSTFTCPINGVNTQPAGGTNTLGGGVWWNGGRVWLDRLYVTNMAEDGLTNSGGIGTKYTDIGIIACGGWGLNMTANLGNNGVNYATDGDLSSVWVGACGQGLIVNTGGIWISGAHIWGCQGDGIYLNGDAVRVIGCYPENNAGWGININSRSRCIIQGNDVWANGLGSVQKGGIQTLGSANSNVITSNLLRDNRYHAVLLAGSSSRNTVALNTVCDSYYRQASSPATLITYTASATLAAGTSTFTDANAPAWMTSFSAVGLTIVIQGAGTSGGSFTAQVTGWANPSAGVYNLTLSIPTVTAVTNPVYAVASVGFGVRESGTASNNMIENNVIAKNDALLGPVATVAVATGPQSSSRGNSGWTGENWYEVGTIPGGALAVDLRIGDVTHGTLTSNITSISIFPSGGIIRGSRAIVILKQDGVGGRTVTGWPANVQWVSGVAPVFPTAAGASLRVALTYDGTNWIGEYGKSAAIDIGAQVATEFGGGTYTNTGAAQTISATPSTLTVASTANFPLTAATAFVGTGVPQGTLPGRFEVNYTGMDATHLTGVTSVDGASHTVPDKTNVWYSKSGLTNGSMVVANQIITGTGADGRPHDLALIAAFDPTVDHSKGDYDIVLTRQAGSYGVLQIDLPAHFPRDTGFYDGVNRKLLTFAAGPDAVTNNGTPSPLPIGAIEVAGTLIGDQGTDRNLVLRNSGLNGNSRIYLQKSDGTEYMRVDDSGVQFPNNTYIRINGVSGNYAAISVTAANTLSFNLAGSAGWRIVTPNIAATVVSGDINGNMTIAGGMTQSCRTIIANGTATLNDSVVICKSPLTQVGLPSAVTAGNGRQYTLKNATGASISVVATAGTVDVATIANNAALRYVSDGTNWYSL